MADPCAPRRAAAVSGMRPRGDTRSGQRQLAAIADDNVQPVAVIASQCAPKPGGARPRADQSRSTTLARWPPLNSTARQSHSSSAANQLVLARDLAPQQPAALVRLQVLTSAASGNSSRHWLAHGFLGNQSGRRWWPSPGPAPHWAAGGGVWHRPPPAPPSGAMLACRASRHRRLCPRPRHRSAHRMLGARRGWRAHTWDCSAP